MFWWLCLAFSSVKDFPSSIETEKKWTLENPRFSIYTGLFVKHDVNIDAPDSSIMKILLTNFLPLE